MTKMIKGIDKAVNGFLTWVVVLMLAVMSVVVFGQVVFRLVHATIPWSEELSKYMLIWTTFLGSALSGRSGDPVYDAPEKSGQSSNASGTGSNRGIHGISDRNGI